MRILLPVCLAVLACALPGAIRPMGDWGQPSPPPVGEPAAPEERHAPGEVVVRWRAGVSAAALEAVGGWVMEEESYGPVTVLGVPAGSEVQAARHLASLAEVTWAQPNYIRRVQMAPNDPLFHQQWGLQKIQAPTAWNTTTGAPSVVVAVVDTGVDLRHPELQGKLVPGQNFLQPGSAPQDDGGHGTHVAGTIAATLNNSVGIAGIASGVSIMPVKVLRASGSGRDSTVAAGIRWATENGARVVNMSFTGTDASPVLSEAVEYAASRNVALVVAAGNEGASAPSYPAATDPAIAVAATNMSDRRAPFSNYGPWVDIAAPGWSILSTSWDGTSTYKTDNGTSTAAPHVSGVIALLLSLRPSLTIAEVEGILKATADPVGDAGMGAGRVNAARAVAALGQAPSASPVPTVATATPSPTPTPTLTPLLTPAPTVAPTPASASAALAYRAALSSQTLYLPALRYSEGWRTEVTIQNTTGAAGSLQFYFVDEDGSFPGVGTYHLAPFGSAKILFDESSLHGIPLPPSKWRLGPAAVIRSSVPVAAVVRIFQDGGDGMAYDGQTQGSDTVYSPLPLHRSHGWSTMAFVQNLGEEAAGVEVLSTGPEGPTVVWTERATIPPLATRSFSPAGVDGLLTEPAGAIIARSTNGQPLALVVLQTSTAGAAWAQVGSLSGGTSFAVPVVFKNWQASGAWSSGIQLQNVGDEPARVNVAYALSDRSGPPLNEAATIPPGGSRWFSQPANEDLPDGFSGAATVSVENGQPVVGVVSIVRDDTSASMSYELQGASDLAAHAPLFVRGVEGYHTNLRVQNRGQLTAAVFIIYWTAGGDLLAAQATTIDAGAVRAFDGAGLPESFTGSATINSLNGQPLATIVTMMRR